MKRLRANVDIIFLVLVSLVISFQILHSGFFPMHDDTQPTRVFQMSQALKDGQFPVRVVKDLGYGYTYPIFNFYAPLPYYIGAIFNLMGFSALTATKIMFVIPVFIAPISLQLFVKEILNKKAALVASTIYTTFPYFAVNIFVRGAVGEYYAYALIPLVFLGIYKIYENTSSQTQNIIAPIIITSLSFSALTISHNLSAYMSAIFILVYSTVLFFFSKMKMKFIVYLIASGLLSLLLSSFYIVPALLEMQYTNVQAQIGSTANFRDHFICLPQLWNSQWGFGGSSPTCLDGFSFKLGKSNIIFSVLGLALALYFIANKKTKKTHIVVFTSLITTIAFLFTQQISSSLWESIPRIEFLQYPWRFLNYLAFSLSLLTGIFIFFLGKYKSNRLTLFATILILAITIFLNLKLFKPQFYNDNTSDYYTNTRSIRYNISKISDEYLPKDFKKPLSESDIPQKPFQIVEGEGQVTDVTDSSNEKTATIVVKDQAKLKANIAYFPSWRLRVNNDQEEYKATDNGLELFLSKGTHQVVFKFENTRVQAIANIASFTGVLLAFIGIIFYKSKLKNEKTN